jgi:hypothetical protein
MLIRFLTEKLCFFSDRTMRRKNKWTCLAVIGSIIIITAIVVPITIIKTSEDNKIARNTTIKTGANGTTPKPITEKTATTPKPITEKTATTPKPITETTTTTTIFDDNEKYVHLCFIFDLICIVLKINL